MTSVELDSVNRASKVGIASRMEIFLSSTFNAQWLMWKGRNEITDLVFGTLLSHFFRSLKLRSKEGIL